MQVLKEGMRGALVEMLQLALCRAGVCTDIDGIFGQDTLRMLKKFQGKEGLEADGIAGPKTWAALRPRLANPRGPIVPTQISWSSELLGVVVDGLRARFPFLRVATIGSSVLCKPLYQISIGRGNTRVGYNAAHHANEWITTPVLLKFLEQFAAGVAHGGSIGGVACKRLYHRFTLDIFPMVNPDGVGVA